MKTLIKSSTFLLFFCAYSFGINAQELYTKSGSDQPWETIIKNKQIPVGSNSTKGITGSTINVKNELVEKGPYANQAIESNIAIHTVGNGTIPRQDFDKWSRWYQEDGNTQIFRLHKGEYNVRNSRQGAPRIEAESKLTWDEGGNKWHEWVGTYTIVKAHEASLFQIFADPVGVRGGTGIMMIEMRDNGDVFWNKRDGQVRKTFLTNAEGKSFDVRVRDNGYTYELYINGELFETNSIKRESRTHFRWGMYSGDNMKHEAMIFVTGATVDPQEIPTTPNQAPTVSFENPTDIEIEEGYTSLYIKANPQDPEGKVSNVTLFIDDKEIRTESNAPYEWGHNDQLRPETLGLTPGEHTLKVVVRDEQGATGESTMIITVLDPSLSVRDFTKNSLVLYPNPSKNGIFNLPNTENITVFDSYGKMVLKDFTNTINLSGLSKGLYFVSTEKASGKIMY